MRQRTFDEISACPHDLPLVEVCTHWEYGRRGDFAYKILGCTQCGGFAQQLSLHINRGDTRTRERQDQLNDADASATEIAVKAWRDALPEPEVAHAAP